MANLKNILEIRYLTDGGIHAPHFPYLHLIDAQMNITVPLKVALITY